jgi:DNA polymerase-3 subunit delta'
MMNIGQDKNKLVYLGDEEVAFAKKFSSFIHEKNINLLSSEFTLANSHIAANGNPKIVFLDLALNIVKYIRVRS